MLLLPTATTSPNTNAHNSATDRKHRGQPIQPRYHSAHSFSHSSAPPAPPQPPPGDPPDFTALQRRGHQAALFSTTPHRPHSIQRTLACFSSAYPASVAYPAARAPPLPYPASSRRGLGALRYERSVWRVIRVVPDLACGPDVPRRSLPDALSFAPPPPTPLGCREENAPYNSFLDF